MKHATRKQIKDMISRTLSKKIDKHRSETLYSPFFDPIFGKEQVRKAALMQSFYTTFGMSIYEQAGKILAEQRGFEAHHQYHLLGSIDIRTASLINKITNELKSGKRTGNAAEEMRLIRSHIKKSKPKESPNNIVDLFIKDRKGREYYFGISTVKQNKEGFENHKNKLLRWMGLRLSQGKWAKFSVSTVLPYNPYYPKKYSRFASDTLFDRSQLLIQEDFWDFVGGKGTFDELADICAEVGKELKAKIDSL